MRSSEAALRVVALALWPALAAAGGAGEPPRQVLDGTGIRPLDSYELVPVDPSFAGRYVAETGGASASLVLSHDDGAWQAERRIAEPGRAPDIRAFVLEAGADGSLRSPDAAIELRGAEDGVLLLEADGGDLVPPDLWTLYWPE